MNTKTLSQATKSNRRDAGKNKNYSLALQHTISFFSDVLSNFFFKKSPFFCPIILSVLFECPIFSPIFFVRLFCPFYLNVRYFVRSIWMCDFFCSIFLVWFFSDLFKCPIFLVRSILLSDFFVWCFVRSSLMSDFSVQCFFVQFFVRSIWMSDFFSDFFVQFFVRSILKSDFFFWFFVRDIWMSDFFVRSFYLIYLSDQLSDFLSDFFLIYLNVRYFCTSVLHVQCCFVAN